MQRGGGRFSARRSKSEQIKLDGAKARLRHYFPSNAKRGLLIISPLRGGGGGTEEDVEGSFGVDGGGRQQICAGFFLRAKTKEGAKGRGGETEVRENGVEWSGAGAAERKSLALLAAFAMGTSILLESVNTGPGVRVLCHLYLLVRLGEQEKERSQFKLLAVLDGAEFSRLQDNNACHPRKEIIKDRSS